MGGWVGGCVCGGGGRDQVVVKYANFCTWALFIETLSQHTGAHKVLVRVVFSTIFTNNWKLEVKGDFACPAIKILV